jgi:hypothetical protein
MFEAIVTYVGLDTEVYRGPEDRDIVVTKVYRLEFESERDFGIWMNSSPDAVLHKEFLKAAPTRTGH